MNKENTLITANVVVFIWDLYMNSFMDPHNRDIPLTWICPASSTFAIWGLIYFTLIFFLLAQFHPLSRKQGTIPYKLVHESISILFMMVCLVNGSWIMYWNKFPAGNMSLFLMMYLLIALGTIYFHFDFVIEEEMERFRIISNIDEEDIQDNEEQNPLLEQETNLPQVSFRGNYSSSNRDFKRSCKDSILIWSIKIPFSLYFAWILMATILSFFVIFVPIDPLAPFTTIPFAMVVIILIGILGILMLMYNQDFLFTLVLVWGLLGISHSESIKRYPGWQADLIHDTSFITCTSLFLVTGFTMIKYLFSLRKSSTFLMSFPIGSSI